MLTPTRRIWRINETSKTLLIFLLIAAEVCLYILTSGTKKETYLQAFMKAAAECENGYDTRWFYGWVDENHYLEMKADPSKPARQILMKTNVKDGKSEIYIDNKGPIMGRIFRSSS